MPRRPKDIGTDAERLVVRYLQTRGFPHAERRALHGTRDLGDVTGTPGLVWEVKGGDAAKTASDRQIVAWLAETETERSNADAVYGFLVTARARHTPSAWWAHLYADQLAHLLTGHDARPAIGATPVRLTLSHLCDLLTLTGWSWERTEPKETPCPSDTATP